MKYRIVCRVNFHGINEKFSLYGYAKDEYNAILEMVNNTRLEHIQELLNQKYPLNVEKIDHFTIAEIISIEEVE